MSKLTHLSGVYAAIITPYTVEGALDEQGFTAVLAILHTLGAHGVLVSGTTGEGPSLTVDERIRIFRLATESGIDLAFLAGTGAASLEDASSLTKAAFDLGMDAVVVIPPFFYIAADDDGLFGFYKHLINNAVPSDGAIILYSNAPVCGIGLSIALIQRLRDTFPDQVAGIKDSSYDLAHTLTLIKTFPGLAVITGDDKALAETLAAGGAGSITLVNNLFADRSRRIYNASNQQVSTAAHQQCLDEAHYLLSGLPRVAALKTVFHACGLIQDTNIRPPLRPLTREELQKLAERLSEAGISAVGQQKIEWQLQPAS
nr:dihydrodipicolinate synthase family protein [Anaerolineae bacterium]